MLQLNTSRPAYPPVARPIPHGRKARVVQFGLLRPKDLQDYHDALQQIHDVKKYGTDLYRSYLQLPETGKRQIEGMIDEIRPEEIRKMNDRHRLGPIEESGDTGLELIARLSLERKLFTPEKVQAWKDYFLGMKAKQSIHLEKGLAPFSFTSFKSQIGNSFSREDIKWCSDLLGGNEAKARDFLGIIGVKFALFDAYEPNFHLLSSNRPLLQGEAKELNEHLPVISADRFKIWFLAWSYTNLPPWLRIGSPEYFMNQLVEVVSKHMKMPNLQLEDLLDPLRKKQIRRQELDFDRHTLFPEKRDRKGLVKGFEIIGEAEALKRADEREQRLLVQA